MRYSKKRLPEKNHEADAALSLLTLKIQAAGKKASIAFAAWAESAAVSGDTAPQTLNAIGAYYQAVGEANAYKTAYSIAFDALSAVLKKESP